jgi:flavin-binding protein dodecin
VTRTILATDRSRELFEGIAATYWQTERRENMSTSTYKIIELVGTSDVSWEEAAKNAVEVASKSLRELRIAEVTKLDMRVEKGKIVAYRARVNLSFKYEGGE